MKVEIPVSKLQDFWQKGLTIKDLVTISDYEIVEQMFRGMLNPPKEEERKVRSNNNRIKIILNALTTGKSSLDDLAYVVGLTVARTKTLVTYYCKQGFCLLNGDVYNITRKGEEYLAKLGQRKYIKGFNK